MMTVAAVVLAAGGSRRLGRPKQLLPFRGATLLDATLATARASGVAQVLLTVGGSADEVRDTVGVAGVDVVPAPDFTEGCAASIRAAVRAVRADAEGLVVLLGDQPGVTAESVRALIDQARGSDVGVCAYDDGHGHPLWFSRRMFDRLEALHGDKAVWKLVDAAEQPVVVRVPGPVPPDVDTWEDYETLLASAGPEARP